ncbi:MAG TPA: twin-arginine translocation signal domain-containing protein [Candidatus Limnocylindrales bacterium]|nr:twin-arginine translocation signal domain-containing protein [Candidatus Limnocylindrales bacterium]
MNRRDFLVSTAIAGGVSLTGPLATAQRTTAAPQTSFGPRTTVIDTHAHWYPQAWVDMVAKEGPKYGAKVGKNQKGYVTYSLACFIREGDVSDGWCRDFKAKMLVAA